MNNERRKIKVEKINFKGEEVYTIKLKRWLSHGKEWAALIVNGVITSDGKKILNLEFCPKIICNWSRSGKNGETIVKLLGGGFYKISNPDGLYGKDAIAYYFWDGKSDEMKEVDEDFAVLYADTWFYHIKK